MLAYLRLLFWRFLVCAVASVCFILVLAQVHDYNQTRQAIRDYTNGDGLAWLVGFYFVNEASSGIKYAMTGNRRHIGYFPTEVAPQTKRDARRAYRVAMFKASNGDWREQLRVSHMLATGWGVAEDERAAVNWYIRAEENAAALGEVKQWDEFPFRERVRVYIADGVAIEQFARDLGHRHQPGIFVPLLPPVRT